MVERAQNKSRLIATTGIEGMILDMDQSFQAGTLGWLYLPTAIVLGALHGMEPGHSKTMMASFIIAIRGTVKQAVLLGVAATISHTAIIWMLAAAALWWKGKITTNAVEPYLEILSALIVFTLAGWTAWRTWKSSQTPHFHEHQHEDDDRHEEKHHDHLHFSGQTHQHPHPMIENAPTEKIHQGAHERFHAEQIREQCTGGEVTNQQIILFGLTGGLMPCPAAFTVLLLCLQGGRTGLGFSIVLAFSIGLALTLVGVGTAAAIGARYATGRFSALSKWSANAPYLSSIVLIVLGLYMLVKGLAALHM